jgi:hypothetical protein
MNGNLAQFADDLRPYLLRLQVSLDNLSGLFSWSARPTEAQLEIRTAEMQRSAKETSDRATKLRDFLQAALEHDAGITQETMAGWIVKRQTARLHARADLLEQSAILAAELAALTAVEAERITMAAVNARRQAIALQIEREAGSGL